MTDRAGRPDPPAQLAKIATAGATGVFVFGLAAAMGWADRPVGEPALVPLSPLATVPATTTTGAAPSTTSSTSTLVPLATTIPVAPVAAPVPIAPPVAVTEPPAPPPPAPAPVIVVSEQSQ